MTASGRKIVFITGAATGVGAEIAQRLAADGAGVALAVRNAPRVRELCDRIEAAGGEALAVECDVTDEAAVAAAIAAAVARFGGIDVVINNAGSIDPIGKIADTPAAAWQAALATNLSGPFIVTQAALPHLLERQGIVMNISTGAAHRAWDSWSAYCSAKAGLSMLTRCVDVEYGADGLYAIAVQPGMVDTGMQVRIRASGANDVSKIKREELLSPAVPARAISWIVAARPAALRGRDVSLADLRNEAGDGADW